MIKVFIIDDHKMVIEGMELLLQHAPDITVSGYACTGEEGLENLKTTAADVVLLDVNLPGLNGIDTCKEIVQQHPHTQVIAITMHQESSIIKLMLAAGAKGYVLKHAGQDEVIEAITTVHSGKMYIEESVNNIIVNSLANNAAAQKSSPFPTLTKREKEILKLILDEKTTQEIAEQLFISFGTVETHRRNMLIKTGSRNTAGLVRTALEFNLTD